ncbi:MAG: hypothetical protein ABI882_16535 [Acidobacteriota bacterium]
MNLKGLFIACSLLMPLSSIFAQSAGVAADAISGTWKGSMGAGGTDVRRTPITVELKLDSKSGLSGTVTGPPQPGEIKTGSFDVTTGALKFEVTVSGNPNPFVFEGTVAMGTVTGRITVGSNGGLFNISKTGSEPSAAPVGSEASERMRKSFAEVSGYVIKAADLVAADKYGYRPAESVRTFGQVVAHIADSYNYFCAQAAGRNVQWSEAIEKGAIDKATLVEKLKQATDSCNAPYGGDASKPGPLIDNISHTNLHYGNIITYMRILGLKPPSS